MSECTVQFPDFLLSLQGVGCIIRSPFVDETIDAQLKCLLSFLIRDEFVLNADVQTFLFHVLHTQQRWNLVLVDLKLDVSNKLEFLEWYRIIEVPIGTTFPSRPSNVLVLSLFIVRGA